MPSRALLVAGVAAALLIVTVGVDLAFNSTVELRVAAPGGEEKLLAAGGLDGAQLTHAGPLHTIEANRSDSVTFTVKLVNAMPWATTKTLTLSAEGCYDGARALATFRLAAAGNGVASQTADVRVADLLASYPYSPRPLEPEGTPTSVHVQVCRGERYITAAQISIQEVPR